MLAHALLFVSSFVPQGGGSPAPVVINEFSYDDSGTDDREFVELFNRSGAPVDIGGWVLDSDDPFGTNTDFTIPTGTVLAAGGFWVMGSDLVANVDQIVGTTNIWENSNESLTLRDLNGRIVDTLVYEANLGVWDPTLAEGEGVWGNHTNINGIETSWSRLRDGWDSDNNGRDFRVAPETPGASNNLPDALPVAADFDAALPGDVVPGWGGSFKPPHVVDPTVADAYNPNAIAASPQGGNAGIFWDETGGGNLNMLLTDAADSVEVEAWVYFDAAPEVSGGREMWTLGVQGTSGTFYNQPDPSGLLGFTSNGNTGIGWTYQVLDSGATLFLVDHNDGGTDFTVLGQVAVTPGVNDGWQRLRLSVTASSVEANFGGTFGQNDGVAFASPISGAIGGIYVGYREFVVDNSTLRPFTVDALSITSTAACSSLSVTGGPLSIDVALNGDPNAWALLIIGDTPGTTSISMGPVASVELGLQRPFVPVMMGLTDAAGDASLTMRLPPNGIARGAAVAQGMTVVFTPPPPGPPTIGFCTSNVVSFTFGGK